VNEGNGILVAVCLYLGMTHGFNWYLISFIVFGVAMWSYHAATGLAKKRLALEVEKLNLEIAVLKKQLRGEW